MLYKSVNPEDIIAEYSASSSISDPHAKAKWGSPEGMINRFRLTLRTVDFAHVRTWLDLGCGTGHLFALAEETGHRLERMTGVDITPGMIAAATRNTYHSPIEFICKGIMDLDDGLGQFDLVTMIGILQQCAAPPQAILPCCIQRVRPGGQLFLTTKNLAWSRFTSGELQPEAGHSWFHYQELANLLETGGMHILQCGGFLPREDKIVPLEESHTLYILGRRES